MRFWIVETGEPLPSDPGARLLRCGVLSQMLAEAGHDVIWWASTFSHARKRQRFSEPTTLRVRAGLVLRLLYGPPYRHNVTFARLRHNRAVARAFWEEADGWEAPDLVFSCMPTPEMAEKSVAFGRKCGVPVIVDVRDRWPDLYLTILPGALRPVGRLLLAEEYRRIRRTLALATCLTAVSESFLFWALDLAGRQRSSLDEVFPLGYAPLEESPHAQSEGRRLRRAVGIADTEMVVMFAGIFGASYDLETVVAAAKILESGGNSPRFVLAGSGDKEERIRSMASGLKNLVFTGWLDKHDLQALLRTSDAGLAPYGKCALQSLPNKPYEYLAAGLPMISSLRGELAEILGDHRIGVQYEPGDAEGLARAVRWLQANSDQRLAMGARAHALFDERYSTRVVYPALIAHLEQVASRSGGQ